MLNALKNIVTSTLTLLTNTMADFLINFNSFFRKFYIAHISLSMR